ncbi:hypothetical protein Tco_0399811, partial [Tanacetum coccineum]
HKAWDDVVAKLRKRLSKWKAKTLSIGTRFTLLKSVLGASPLYTMSIFKVPKGVLNLLTAKAYIDHSIPLKTTLRQLVFDIAKNNTIEVNNVVSYTLYCFFRGYGEVLLINGAAKEIGMAVQATRYVYSSFFTT